MKKIKLFSLAAIGAMALVGAVSCGDGTTTTDNSNTFKVWAPIEHKAMYEQIFTDFKAANPEYADMKFEFGACSEAEAYNQVSKDVTGAADVFTMANDQLYNLINIGALAQIGDEYKTFVETNNSKAAVDASKGTRGGIYAYPMTLDNGYMLTYDASVVKDYDENTTFFDVAKQCAEAGKQFVVPMGDSWYGYGFFAGFGGKYSVEYGADGKESKITCNYNEQAGVDTGNFLIDLANTTGFTYVDGGAAGDGGLNLNTYLDTNMSKIGAFISYPGAVKTYVLDKDAWDDANVRCDVLPLMKENDTTKRMRTFLGMKMVGVNKQSQNLVLAHKFAQYITSEEVQLLRYKNYNYGPSNIKAAEDEAVKSDVALVGLNKQFEVASDPQINVPSTFWTAVQNFGCSVGHKKEINKENLQASLDSLVEDMITIA